jgi:hypothetical protein
MSNPDSSLETLRQIDKEFASIRAKGELSEADTRVKLIDRILTQVCGWPEAAIRREDHVKRGYIDYSLTVQARHFVAVEAKREGVSFTFPHTSSKTLKLSGSLLSDKNVSEAILQVRGYCDDGGIDLPPRLPPNEVEKLGF